MISDYEQNGEYTADTGAVEKACTDADAHNESLGKGMPVVKQKEDAEGKVLRMKSMITPQNAMAAGLVVFVLVILLSVVFGRKKEGSGNEEV